MYLAQKYIDGKTHFFIRESYKDNDGLTNRDLFDLGPDPTRFIVYPGGASFYIHEEVHNQLAAIGVNADNDTLERIFFPFLNSRTRRVIEGFSHKSIGRNQREAIREQVARCDTERFHLFDQRRMHYLRYGELDQSKMFRASRKIYLLLLDKSRDEIEQLFTGMERDLRDTEKKTYTYVIFDVAGHFPGIFARKFPHALPQEKVDAFFLEEVCRLNDDREFWAGLERTRPMDDYLVKYVCWFFDNDFEEVGLMEHLFTEWVDQRRAYRPQVSASMPVDEALSVMEITREELSTLTVRTLTRQYRKVAKTRHPDKGGSHEYFIKLNHAYSDLLRTMKSRAKP